MMCDWAWIFTVSMRVWERKVGISYVFRVLGFGRCMVCYLLMGYDFDNLARFVASRTILRSD